MRKSAFVVPALVMLALAGCTKKKPVASPPIAPVAPPLAPPPPNATSQAEPPPVDEYARLRAMSAEEIDRLGLFAEVRFDFDSEDIRDDARSILSHHADTLKRFDFLTLTIEGHCDERGTVEYNLALGDRRSSSTREYLVTLGVPVTRLRSSSYGKESPTCRDANEDCWARNRRAAFRVTGAAAP